MKMQVDELGHEVCFDFTLPSFYREMSELHPVDCCDLADGLSPFWSLSLRDVILLPAGHWTGARVWVAICGFLVTAVLMIRGFRAAIFAGLLLPSRLCFWSPFCSNRIFPGVLTSGFFPVGLTIFIMAFVDTMGILIGASARAGFLDENGNLPQIERPMAADALSSPPCALWGKLVLFALRERYPTGVWMAADRCRLADGFTQNSVR